jgi:hypothetical protein
MTDQAELLTRAKELTERAAFEEDPSIRERLTEMAKLYTHLAESEGWLAANPVSLAGVGDLIVRSD